MRKALGDELDGLAELVGAVSAPRLPAASGAVSILRPRTDAAWTTELKGWLACNVGLRSSGAEYAQVILFDPLLFEFSRQGAAVHTQASSRL